MTMRGVMIGAGFFAQFQADAWKRLEGRLSRRPGPAASLPPSSLHAPPAAGMPPLLVAAIADPVPGKAREFAAKFGIARAYESVEAMLDAEKPDFVDIATRPDMHLPLTRLAAARGIHVISQKPMAPTMAECMAMCKACEQANVRLLIHENWRWQPWYREAKRRIAAGELGALQHLSFDWRTGDGNGPEPFAAQPYFREMPRLIIYESLIHILDTFRFLAGELRVTACETRRVNPAIVGEDWSEIQCAFEGGAKGFIHGDRQTGPAPAPLAMGSMVIEGERSTLRITGDGQLIQNRTGAMDEKLPFTPPTSGYKGDSVLATQRHLLDCLRTGVSSESDGREYLKTVTLVEDCYRIAATPSPL